jgi:hypothetical protein
MNAGDRASLPAHAPAGAGAVFALSSLLLVAFILAAYALTFPQLTGRVVDEAGIIDLGVRAALA